jgi:hypothetical protein
VEASFQLEEEDPPIPRAFLHTPPCALEPPRSTEDHREDAEAVLASEIAHILRRYVEARLHFEEEGYSVSALLDNMTQGH